MIGAGLELDWASLAADESFSSGHQSELIGRFDGVESIQTAGRFTLHDRFISSVIINNDCDGYQRAQPDSCALC